MGGAQATCNYSPNNINGAMILECPSGKLNTNAKGKYNELIL